MDDTNLTLQDLEWLKVGGPFPDTLRVDLGNGDSVSYALEDRDERGFVSGLAGRHGKKGFVLFVRDPNSDARLAAKLCLESDYNKGRTPATESKLAQVLKGANGLFCIPMTAGRVDAFPGQPNATRHWVCFISERIEGLTVQRWIETQPEAVTPALACEVLRKLVQAVIYLSRKNLKHDDLHWGNLMLRPEDPDLTAGQNEQPTHQLCIIDTGSLKPIAQDTAKAHDDWTQVAGVASRLHNCLFSDRSAATRHSTFLLKWKQFCNDLLETERSRVFPCEEDIYAALGRAEEALYFGGTSSAETFDPFDAISAEHLAGDHLLLKLFTEALPWMKSMIPARPTVLTGPRGCGKSMVLRYLSAKVHVATRDASGEFLDRIPFLGIYVSCSSDLQSDVLWIAREPSEASRCAHSIITLFNLLLVREFFRALDHLLQADAVARRLRLTPAHIEQLIRFCRDYIGPHSAAPRLRVSTLAGDFADELDRHRRQVSRLLSTENTPSITLPASFIREFAREASNVIPGLKGRPIVFLLDDYTSHRIPLPVQHVLNPIVFSRQAEHLFKVSCEKFGFTAKTDTGLNIDVDREYEWIDAGQYVLDMTTHADRKEFLIALLDLRLQTAQYTGRVKDLIGESTYKHDTDLARRIRATGSGRDYFYNGLEVLSNLWSGDIATILHMVRAMFRRAKIGPESRSRISNQHQHESIRQVSRGLVQHIDQYTPYGQTMGRILAEFAALAKELLIEGQEDQVVVGEQPRVLSEADQRTTPQRKYRIELTRLGGRDIFDQLADMGVGKSGDGEGSVKDLAMELLRRSVFIDVGPSRGKESKSSETLRWQIRSSLLPHFGLSLIRHNYIDVKSVDDFVSLLISPEKFRLKYRSRGLSSQDLFSGSGGSV